MHAPSHRLTRRHLLQAAALLPLPSLGLDALAQEVTKLLVGFPAGGAIDSTARLYADAAKETLGTMIIENKAGAAGNIAATALAQAPADGQTMMMAPVNVYCISQALYRQLAFDAARDFAPVGIVAQFPWALAVHPSVPATNLQEFVAWAKAHPERTACGMAAMGSEGHLMAYAFSRAAGVPIFFVGYKGGAPMAQDLMAGQIPMAFDPIVNLAQPHKSGKIRMLAITSAQRNELTPEVPTFAESGYEAASGGTWIGAAVRKGTPAARIARLADALSKAAARPDVQRRLASLGLQTASPSPEEMARTMQTDAARYAQLVQAVGLRLE